MGFSFRFETGLSPLVSTLGFTGTSFPSSFSSLERFFFFRGSSMGDASSEAVYSFVFSRYWLLLSYRGGYGERNAGENPRHTVQLKCRVSLESFEWDEGNLGLTICFRITLD